MIDLLVVAPQGCILKQFTKAVNNDLNLTIELSFSHKKTFQKGDFFIGFKVTNVVNEKTFLMTHEQDVNRYALPFAFPAFMGRFSNHESCGAWMVLDYYNTHKAFRVYHKTKESNMITYGLSSEAFEVNEHEVIILNMTYHIYQISAPRLTSMIQKCAKHVMDSHTIQSKTKTSLTTNIHNYEDAAYGVSNDLMDDRARIKDGTGTFIPYGYLEKNPYSESFALMDVAKGMLPYAIWLKNNKLFALIEEELLKITDDSRSFPWIDHDHQTNGFFHLAWGSLPVGVTESHVKNQSSGLFSDVDGHEEGPNLLSTWKYFYRVEILGEMALLSNKKQIIDGFIRTLPFVNKLKLSNYAQPVTYDLDTHLPVTGYNEGGSAGGAAFWSIIHLTAYDLTKDKKYLYEALNGLDHANLLDFDHYYSMRVAPKPVTVGWLTKANVYAYELTKDIKYIKFAREVAQSIYFFYYVSPHPYAYFSTMGYGYACSRERWEAFLEMVESLYSLSFFLKYNEDNTLLKLFWHARENWLWALPLNGNPYGNLERPYDSIGGTYIPYEFSTGSLGDNPGLDGGSQSTMRQIKEIYGSGEVYLAYMMFEMNAKISDRNFLIVKSDNVNDLLNPTLNFIVYNTQSKNDKCIVAFDNLSHDSYEVYQDQLSLGIFDTSYLKLGIPFEIKGESQSKLTLKPVDSINQKLQVHQADLELEFNGYEAIEMQWNPSTQDGHTHYRIVIKNEFYVRTYDLIDENFNFTIDRELEHQVEVLSISPSGISKNETVRIEAQQREILYRLNEDSMNDVTYQNADLIYDGHLWMFYGHDTVDQISVNIEVQKTFSDQSIIQLEIASLNESCVYDILIHHGKNLTSKYNRLSKTELIEVKIHELANEFIESIEIILYGKKGLGFSLKRCDVISSSSIKNNMVHLMRDIKPKKIKNLYVIETVLNTEASDYIDIYVEGLSKGSELIVFLNNKEANMDIEKKYPEKKYRHMNSIYRFKSDKRSSTHIVVASHAESMKVLAIRLTNQQQYPKYAEYKQCKEDDYEK
ncbi:hypothetical protein [Peloplasma aerotolerans]|uniref:Glycosyl hydrolase 36 catalytic domain-containing protein n=1 Tax=Peloplasma aerotolerans TaxID=3044389 RepID=A0AAW6U8L7_9MOLU|nr:hypothetical protein [Mariniplasma sp. M4Ah]MDI6452817.1 hypothetical protein [Mariniplasma sp. M4Ah]